MKKLVFVVLMLIGISQISMAQLNLCVYKYDGSVSKFLALDVDSVSFTDYSSVSTTPEEAHNAAIEKKEIVDSQALLDTSDDVTKE